HWDRRRQTGRPGTAAHDVTNAYVGELGAGPRAPEQQPAAAHVAAAHEVGGKPQPLAQDGQQRIDVLAGGDAAEQDDLAARSDAPCQPARVAVERLAV